jgi:hypothetical protein
MRDGEERNDIAHDAGRRGRPRTLPTPHGDALQRQGDNDGAKKAFETYLQLAPAGGLAQHAKDAIAAL